MGGGLISPAVAAHLRNQNTPPRPALPGKVGDGDGGCGAPQVRRHMHQEFGSGGVISPALKRHLHK
jgi:hypothetical protein